jgi:hypothetical protein
MCRAKLDKIILMLKTQALTDKHAISKAADEPSLTQNIPARR